MRNRVYPTFHAHSHLTFYITLCLVAETKDSAGRWESLEMVH